MTTVVDLFAGCGGLSKGFENAGYQIRAAFENWDKAADCYELNFDHPVERIDLSDTAAAIDRIREYAPDMIIGGPPCQDFSHAGKRVEAQRASLTDAFAEIVATVKPAMFVMENVDRAQKSNAYAQARRTMKEAGYGLTEQVLLASLCGVPQRRKRFFCIGILGGEDNALHDSLLSGLASTEMTMRGYFGDSLDLEYYYRHPRNYSRRAIFSIDEPAPTMRGVNRPVPQGYPGHPKDACEINPSIRPLTTLERSLVQTFPADFKWAGSKTDQEQMVGNAVPVKLGEYVANAISRFNADQAARIAEGESFRNWLIDTKGFGERYASDTASRLRRAASICEFDGLRFDEYLGDLCATEEFCQLSPAVKSQIKRAVKLLAEYKGGL